MNEFFETPYFGLLLCLLTYEIGILISRKTKMSIFNPLIISVFIIIVILMKFDVNYETFNKGGSLITFFLGPATVILAVPLYKQLNLLKLNLLSILIGIAVGCITALTSVWGLSKLFSLQGSIGLSLIPKSITTPIGVELSKQLGGIPSLTIAAIVITGITGTLLGEQICKIFRISDKIAIGVSIGTSSHALGTTKAIEMGEVEGAMSGLAIGISGFFTVLLVGLFMNFLR